MLPASMFSWVEVHCSRKRTARVFSLLTQKLTCEVMIGESTMKALIDTRALISLKKESKHSGLREKGG